MDIRVSSIRGMPADKVWAHAERFVQFTMQVHRYCPADEDVKIQLLGYAKDLMVIENHRRFEDTPTSGCSYSAGVAGKARIFWESVLHIVGTEKPFAEAVEACPSIIGYVRSIARVSFDDAPVGVRIEE